MVLAITGVLGMVSSVCFTIASLKEDDDWNKISSKLWGNVTDLFTVDSGLLFGKWMVSVSLLLITSRIQIRWRAVFHAGCGRKMNSGCP